MEKQISTFALFFGNRGFMPGELIASARHNMEKAVADAGCRYIEMDETLTRFGAIETRQEGRLYHDWLKENEGHYDGVIVCMPIFIDENGAVKALKDAGVPLLLQAYPDVIGQMDFAHRRDAFCGKFSVANVLEQSGVPFTMLKPHVVDPLSEEFRENLYEFAAICRVVKGMRRFTLGCFGARTTAFKTCRFDEIALEKRGITVETFDLSEVFGKVRALKDDDASVLRKTAGFHSYSDFSKVPYLSDINIAKMAVILDDYVEKYRLDALAVRCWPEMQSELRMCPCTILSVLNESGVASSCEADLCSAISMRALALASNGPSACLDINNNYGSDENKMVLFHCGPVASSLMKGKGHVTAHKMFEKTDPGSGWGCNEGRLRSFPMTMSNCQTIDGQLVVYATEGMMTPDPIEEGFFGVCGVAEVPDLQNKLLAMARQGFKHHTTIAEGHLQGVLEEAFNRYLNYQYVRLG